MPTPAPCYVDFRPELVQTLIEPLILRELCHLIEPNHSKRFFWMLTRHMPGWETKKGSATRLRS